MFPAVEGEYHPQCILFEELTTQQLGKRHSCFNAAIKGSVTSDQYMILSVLKQLHRLPAVVIYGITSRDFINNGLYCPASTPTYQFLDQCFNIGKQCSGAYATGSNHLYAFMIEDMYFLRQSHKIKTLLAMEWNKVFPNNIISNDKTVGSVEKTIAKFPSGIALERDEYKRFPSEVQKDNFLIGRKGFIARDLQQYQLIYKPFPSFSYHQQLDYFDKIAALCKNQGIKLIIVNMPATTENRAILGEEHYRNYLADIKKRILPNDFNFVDMNDVEQFSSGHFNDSLHLNSIGSKIFVTRLARYLCAKSDSLFTTSNGHGATCKPTSACLKDRQQR